MEPLGAQLPLASLLWSITTSHAWWEPQAVPAYHSSSLAFCQTTLLSLCFRLPCPSLAGSLYLCSVSSLPFLLVYAFIAPLAFHSKCSQFCWNATYTFRKITKLCRMAQWKPQGLWENAVEAQNLKTSSVTHKKDQKLIQNGSTLLHMWNHWEMRKDINKYSVFPWERSGVYLWMWALERVLLVSCGEVEGRPSEIL